MSASAHDVAAAIRRRLPGVGLLKLHKLMYFAQGYHLAHTGQTLFDEPLEAWIHGPVVADVWRAEKHDEPPEFLGELDNGQLNTVGYVISRYGNNTGTDLETITHHRGPWRSAYNGKFGIHRRRVIDNAAIREFFLEVLAEDAVEDPIHIKSEVVADFLAGSRERESEPGVPDTIESLMGRLRG